MPDEILQVKVLSDPKGKDWTDHVQFGIDVVMPIITLVFGILILRLTKKLERSQWRSQKVIEKRISEWDQIRLEVNDIFCYCTRVGAWKDLKPTDVIDRKRAADKKMHLARPYFSKGFFDAYIHFIKTCFAHYQGHAVDAKIKSPLSEYQNGYRGQWDQSWDALFFAKPSTEVELWSAYEAMLEKVAEELETRHD
ncbi:MAG: hypothetical protein ACK5ZC_09310 [Pirellulaceae bacterium]|jgi:hypothetical protein